MSQPLPRFTDTAMPTDPLEKLLAQRELETQKAQARINAGHTLDADPADLRGIPCISRGVGGTSPGTNPLQALLARQNRLRPNR